MNPPASPVVAVVSFVVLTSRFPAHRRRISRITPLALRPSPAGKRGGEKPRPEKPRDEKADAVSASALEREPAARARSRDSPRLGRASVVTPRFWDKAATRAEETLGTLSPGSRRRLSTLASAGTGAGDENHLASALGFGVSVNIAHGDETRKRRSGADENAPSACLSAERKDKRRRGGDLALTVPDLLVPSGVDTPLASPHLGDLPSAVGDGAGARSPRRSPRGKDGARVRGGDSRGAKKPVGRPTATDALAPRAAGGPVKKRRPPRLQIVSDNASPLLDADLGTPLLAMSGAGGHVVGDVPGLRGSLSARGSGGMTLRKAVLERWAGIPTPREQDLALTPNDVNVALSPTQFLSTPR